MRSWSPVKNEDSTLPSTIARNWNSSSRRVGKPDHQLEAVAHAQPQELALRAAHETHHLDRAVGRDRAAQECELGSGLALEVQHASRSASHVEHRVEVVVLRDLLAVDGPRAHGEAVGAGRHRRHAELRADDVGRVAECVSSWVATMRPSASTVSVVFSPDSAARTDRRVDQHRGAGEHARRRRDAGDREIALEPLPAHAHRVDRHAPRLEREQRRTRCRRRRCPRRR